MDSISAHLKRVAPSTQSPMTPLTNDQATMQGLYLSFGSGDSACIVSVCIFSLHLDEEALYVRCTICLLPIKTKADTRYMVSMFAHLERLASSTEHLLVPLMRDPAVGQDLHPLAVKTHR